MRRLIAIGWCLLLAMAAFGAQPPAELVLRDATVYTVDAARSRAEAIAIRKGAIVFVGSDAGARAYVGPGTKVVDLQGRLVLPGFQDAHIHPISGGLQLAACDLTGLSRVEDYVETVRRYAAAHPRESWIVGGGWLLSTFGPGGAANRKLLDAAVPDRPVYLSSTDGHTVWVNSKALALAHITAATPDPRDGHIDRDPATGEPLGTLQEGASAPVDALLPQPTAAQRVAALESVVHMLNGYGITAIQDAAVYEADLQTYRRLEARGSLNLHVVAALWWERTQGLEQIPHLLQLRDRYRSRRVDTATVKIMQDGSLENYTAVLLEPYLRPAGGQGAPMVEPAALKTIVTRLDADGFQVHFHAIGDGAVREALDAIEAARTTNGDRDHRHEIAHLELVSPADVPRFRQLGVVANFQPLWAYADPYITDLTIPFIGAERAGHLYPIGSIHRSGAVIAFGSDWNVSSANPFEEIQVAVTRMNLDGSDQTPLLPAERISVAEAIAAFTIGSAYANHLERTTGSIEVGKQADLVVVDRDLFTVPPAEIGKTRALATLFAGRVVHGALPGP